MAYGDCSATKAKQSSKGVNEEMGMWLSLLPPVCHRCLICNKRFNSIQALGGHQNAHRTHQIKVQLNDVDANSNVEKKGRKKKVREVKPIDNDQTGNCTSNEFPMVVANDHGVVANYEDVSGIDLNLNLGFGPRKKVIKLFDFMHVNEMKVDGDRISGACEIPDQSLRIGEIEGDGNLRKASVSHGKRRGKGHKNKSTSKKRVDLTLKL